jgi:hypothetical protein
MPTPPPPQSQRWPSDRALLLVHGIGNTKPGDYDPLVAQIQAVLASSATKTAIYVIYYDYIDDWFADKQQAGLGAAQLVSELRKNTDATAAGNTIADFVGDIIWPVLLVDARNAIQTAIFVQLRQMILDGITSGHDQTQHLSIIAHSMGCFHTYEALQAMATGQVDGLSPSADNVVFDNVIYMASPVQIIRTVGRALGPLVPQADAVHCISASGLSLPSHQPPVGSPVASSRNTVTIAGNLDPVSGYLVRERLDWAYMNLPGATPFIDQEDPLNVTTEQSLASVLQQALQEKAPPKITAQNPHDWGQYVARHASDLQKWLNP